MKRIRNSRLMAFFSGISLGRRSFNFLAIGLITLLVAFLLMPTGLYAGKGGKGKPEPPATVLPNTRYLLTWLDWKVGWKSTVRDISDAGDVVGFAIDPVNPSRSLAYAYLASTNSVVNLNDIPDAAWIDLDTEPTLDPSMDWIAVTASGINEDGQIVGTGEHLFTGETRAFLLVFPIDSPPQFLLLPKVGVTENWGLALNDHGVLVGRGYDSDLGADTTILYTPVASWPWYAGVDLDFECAGVADINNAGVVVTRNGYRAKPPYGNTDVDYFPGYWFFGINDGTNGPTMISGSREKIRGKNGQEGGTIRLSETGEFGDPVEVIFSGGLPNVGQDINDQGDVCFSSAGRGFVYTDLMDKSGDSFGALNLDDLLLNPDADWVVTDVAPIAINSADPITGFGQICGFIDLSERAFLLTPVPFQQEH